MFKSGPKDCKCQMASRIHPVRQESGKSEYPLPVSYKISRNEIFRCGPKDCQCQMALLHHEFISRRDKSPANVNIASKFLTRKYLEMSCSDLPQKFVGWHCCISNSSHGETRVRQNLLTPALSLDATAHLGAPSTHLTLHSAVQSLHTAYYTQHTAQIALYTAHCTLHT